MAALTPRPAAMRGLMTDSFMSGAAGRRTRPGTGNRRTARSLSGARRTSLGRCAWALIHMNAFSAVSDAARLADTSRRAFWPRRRIRRIAGAVRRRGAVRQFFERITVG